MTRRIVVLVGTDHHDFSRLVGWADTWCREHPQDDVLVQHGFSAPPRRARGVELVPPSDLVTLLTKSDVVITHGGPGTIMSARHAGHHPLAVPRDPSKHEHIDQHQMQFVSWAAAKDLCREIVSTDELTRAVSELGPSGTCTGAVVATAPTLDTELLEAAASTPRRRRDPCPAAVPVLYFPDETWQVMEGDPVVPRESVHSRLLVLGQVSQLWLGGRGLRCSCGRPDLACPFWSAVSKQAFEDPGRGAIDRLRSLHRTLREHPVAASRRHPGAERRRRFLELALAYRRVCSAALEISGADVVVDHGGPLADLLPLSHCRQLDLAAMRPPSEGRATALTLMALRYREVPTWQRTDGVALEPSAGRMDEHQLSPDPASALQRSNAR